MTLLQNETTGPRVEVHSAPGVSPARTSTERPEPMLVALRDPVSSRAALDWAASYAAARGVSLTLVHALPAPSLLPPGSSYGDVVIAGRTLVDQEGERLGRDHPALRIDSYLHCGDVVEALLGLASTVQMVVLGSDRRDPGSGQFVGAVAVEVALNAVAPVAVVPASYARSSMVEQDEGGVVVGVDGTIVSRSALLLAAEEASRRRTALTVVTALEAAPEPRTDGSSTMLREVHALFPDLQVRWIVDDVHRADRALDLYGSGADLLVVGRHGAGAHSARSLGAVMHTLLLHPPCPTLVVAPEGP